MLRSSLCLSDWGNTICEGTLHSTLFSDPEKRDTLQSGHLGSWCLKALASNSKGPQFIFPVCQPRRWSSYLHSSNSSKLTSHSPLFTLFPSYIYISLALITVQPRFLQADPNLAITGANGNLSTDSSGLRIIKSWTRKHLQDLEAFQYGFRLDISHSSPS